MRTKTFDGQWRWVNQDGSVGEPCPPPEDEELAKLEEAGRREKMGRPRERDRPCG